MGEITKLSDAKERRAKNMITQDEMREYFRKQNVYVAARDEMLAVQSSLLLRIGNGARQEPGKFRLNRVTYSRRSVSWKTEYIAVMSEKEAQKILDNTKPKRFHRMTWAEGLVNEVQGILKERRK